MRKVAICLILLWASLASAQLQWQTLPESVSVFQQNQAVKQTTLFTPSQPGIYRVTFYFSDMGIPLAPSYYEALVTMQDISGKEQDIDVPITCSPLAGDVPAMIVIALKPNIPLTYAVNAGGESGNCTYNLTVAVEQLQ